MTRNPESNHSSTNDSTFWVKMAPFFLSVSGAQLFALYTARWFSLHTNGRIFGRLGELSRALATQESITQVQGWLQIN